MSAFEYGGGGGIRRIRRSMDTWLLGYWGGETCCRKIEWRGKDGARYIIAIIIPLYLQYGLFNTLLITEGDENSFHWTDNYHQIYLFAPVVSISVLNLTL